jgi:hypothetical protein
MKKRSFPDHQAEASAHAPNCREDEPQTTQIRAWRHDLRGPTPIEQGPRKECPTPNISGLFPTRRPTHREEDEKVAAASRAPDPPVRADLLARGSRCLPPRVLPLARALDADHVQPIGHVEVEHRPVVPLQLIIIIIIIIIITTIIIIIIINIIIIILLMLARPLDADHVETVGHVEVEHRPVVPLHPRRPTTSSTVSHSLSSSSSSPSSSSPSSSPCGCNGLPRP